MQTSTDRQQFRETVALVAAKAKAILPQATNGRVESAVKLVLLDEVQPQADGTVLVGSTSDAAKVYRLSGQACECKDYTDGKAPESWCKHRIAAGIDKRVRELLPPAAESTPEVHPVSTSPLPEAPASVNVRLTIAGRDCQLTLRGVSEDEVLARLEAVLQRYPVSTPPTSPTPRAEPEPEKHYCPRHGTEMQLNHKDGRSWHSHKTDQGWCQGK
jgi:hypothetical protein